MQNNTDTRFWLNQAFLDISPWSAYSYEAAKAKILNFPAPFRAEEGQRAHFSILAYKIVFPLSPFSFFLPGMKVLTLELQQPSCGSGDKCEEKAIRISKMFVLPDCQDAEPGLKAIHFQTSRR